MNEEEFIEDDIDRITYYNIPTSGNIFEGLWVLSALFIKLSRDHKKKKREKKIDESEQLMVPPEKKLETISI